MASVGSCTAPGSRGPGVAGEDRLALTAFLSPGCRGRHRARWKRVPRLSQVTPLRSVLTQGEAVAEWGSPPAPTRVGSGDVACSLEPTQRALAASPRGGQGRRTADAAPRKSGVSPWTPGARPSSPLAEGAALQAVGARGGP